MRVDPDLIVFETNTETIHRLGDWTGLECHKEILYVDEK